MDGESSRDVLRGLYEVVSPPNYKDMVAKAVLEGLRISPSSVTNVLNGDNKLTPHTVKAFVAGCVRYDEDRAKSAQKRRLTGKQARQEHWLVAYAEALGREEAAARPAPRVPPADEEVQPSRLLVADSEVVSFYGREEELAELAAWRDGGARLAVRWLHGPGGQGKTRLALEFGAVSAAAGWRVLRRDQSKTTALEQGPGKLLVVVDYADRLPWDVLLALLGDDVLKARRPTRVLLLARSSQPWLRVEANLGGAATDRVALTALADTVADRLEAFTHARDCFSARLGVDADAVGPPGPLDHPDMGLALTLHMAALVAVDAHARGVDGPRDPAHLSKYLLGREEGHWHALAERSRAFTTPPDTMHQVVFTACLTGRLPYAKARAVVSGFTGQAPDTVLTDHSGCYPPQALPGEAGPVALEPLYPDRLAEDFIALCLPGHDGPARGWAVDALRRLLSRDADGVWREYVDRAITFLAATSAPDRNPHVAPHLAAVLNDDPTLVYAAGNAALIGITHLDPRTLAVIADEAPVFSDPRVDIGVHALLRRVSAELDDQDLDGPTQMHLGLRAASAGEREEAITHLRAAAVTLRLGTTPEDRSFLVFTLAGLGTQLNRRGDPEGTAALAEAGAIARELLASDPEEYGHQVVVVLAEQAAFALESGDTDTAIATYEQVVPLAENLVDDIRLAIVPVALMGLGTALMTAGRPVDALPVLERSVAAYRELQATQPHALDTQLVATLHNLSTCHDVLGHDAPAAEYRAEAIAVGQAIHRSNPTVEHDFGLLIYNQVADLVAKDELDAAVALVWAAVERSRDRRGQDQDHYASLVDVLVPVASALDVADRWREGRPLLEEAVVLARSAGTRIAFTALEQLARELDDLADRLVTADEEPDAAWSVRTWAVEFATSAAARTPLARKTLIMVHQSAQFHAYNALRLPEAVAHLEALVEILDPDTEREDLASIVRVLVSVLVVAGQNLPDDESGDVFARAVDTSLRWQPYFADHATEIPDDVHVALLSATALALTFLNRHTDSVPAAERAVAHLTETSSPPAHGWARQALAFALSRADQDTPRALAACEQALELMVAQLDDTPAIAADIRFTALLNADLLNRLGRPDDAAHVLARFDID